MSVPWPTYKQIEILYIEQSQLDHAHTQKTKNSVQN